MLEHDGDFDWLQGVLDDSYLSAGAHLLDIHGPDRRIDARSLAERLTGMRLLAVATVTRDGRPITGPVDGIFYRGRWHFGTSPHSVRAGHVRRGSAISATYLPSEAFAVTVHGTAEFLDLDEPEHVEFRQTLLDIYLPRYGNDWLDVLAAGVYARINPSRMFAYAHDDTGEDAA